MGNVLLRSVKEAEEKLPLNLAPASLKTLWTIRIVHSGWGDTVPLIWRWLLPEKVECSIVAELVALVLTSTTNVPLTVHIWNSTEGCVVLRDVL